MDEFQNNKAINSLAEKIEALEKAIKGKNQDKPDWLDPQDTLDLLKCSPRTLQSMRDHGKIGFTRIGRKKIFYSRGSIEKLLSKNYQVPFNQ
jgi:hypothetical protein